MITGALDAGERLLANPHRELEQSSATHREKFPYHKFDPSLAIGYLQSQCC